jgi:hypothetical protein
MLSQDLKKSVVNRGPCPSYFCACCRDSSRANVNGTRVGYDHPARELTGGLSDGGCNLQPMEVDEEEWEQAIETLVAFLQRGQDDEAIKWLYRWLPRCMALVPRRRLKTFLKGVHEGAIKNGWIF